MAAWFVLVGTVLVLVRIPFRHVEIVPEAVEFFPGIVLIPAAGILCGPAGVLGVAAGSLVTDAVFGTWGVAALIRAVAFAIGALIAERLWHGRSRPGRGRLVRFVLIGCAACLSVAAWQSLAGTWSGLYPFGYLVVLHLANHLLFICLFAPLVLRFAEAYWLPSVGGWRSAMDSEVVSADSPTWSAVLLWAGGAVACLYGCLAGGWVYDAWPTSAVIGTRTGAWVTVPVTCLLLVQLVGLYRPSSPSADSAPPSDPPRRFGHLLIAPIERG